MRIEALAGRGKWFAGLPPPLRAALLREGRVVRREAGQWVYGQGDARAGVVLVLKGLLRIEASVGDARDVLVNLAPAGTAFGQSRRGGGGPRIATVRAASAATVLLVTDDALERIAHDHVALWRHVGELVYDQLDAMVRLAGHLLALGPRQRIAARLLALAGDDIVRATQADLAEMCGLSRRVANAHLAALEAAGLIERRYRRIAIRETAGLRRFADGAEDSQKTG